MFDSFPAKLGPGTVAKGSGDKLGVKCTESQPRRSILRPLCDHVPRLNSKVLQSHMRPVQEAKDESDSDKSDSEEEASRLGSCLFREGLGHCSCAG